MAEDAPRIVAIGQVDDCYLGIRVAPPEHFLKSILRLSDTTTYREFVSFLSKPPRPGWPRERPQGFAGFFFALTQRPLAFFCERGIVCGMSESDRNTLASKLAEIDQLIAEKEEVIFLLDNGAWTLAEKSLEKLLELRRDLEWELMAQ